MKLKLEHGKKELLNNLSRISNNVVVNNFIYELINHGSITNFFCNENRYYFKSEKNDYISIHLNENGIIVNSLIDGIDQVFQYDKANNNSKIILNITTNINWPNHKEKRTVLLYALYDTEEKLTSYEITTDSKSISDDEYFSEKLKENIYDHYKITTNVEVVGDKLIKNETIDYLYDYTKNRIYYGYAEYEPKTFKTVNSFVKPKFNEIIENEYNLIKKGAQNVKTMV